MPFADLGGVRLFYTDDGASRTTPLLLVHGFAADSHDWMWHLPELSREHRVIAPDLRGHGYSEAPETGYRPHDFAADLTALLDHLGIDRVIAIGHSLGTIVATVLAVEHPERVTALVCVDPAYGQPPEAAAAFPAMIAALAKEPYGTALANDAWCYTPASPEYLRNWHARKILGTPEHVLAQAFAALYSGDGQIGLRAESEAYLARRTCPVLSCWSALQAESAAWEAGLFEHPASVAVSWPGSGHRLHEERPAEFLYVVDKWLRNLKETPA